MKTKTYNFVKCLLFVFLINCSQSTQATLPSNFNNCQVSLDQAVNQLQEIKTQNELNFEFRIVREVTTREECIDKILGTNLEQGAELQNGLLVDLVVGVIQNQITDSVKTSEYELYLLQLEEKNIQNLNLIETPSFGEASVNSIVDGSNVITYIRYENPLNFKFLFSEAEGYIYGVDTNFQKIAHELNSNKTLQIRDRLGSSVFIKLFQRQSSSFGRYNNKKSIKAYEPCDQCHGSPIREQQCLLIQKTYKQSGKKVSVVSRRLNISRTTVYKHILKKQNIY